MPPPAATPLLTRDGTPSRRAAREGRVPARRREAAEGEDDYQHIDTGDSLKVKQILDEATVKAVLAKGYDEVHFIDNLKISLMIIAVYFDAAQFNPIPFPKADAYFGRVLRRRRV